MKETLIIGNHPETLKAAVQIAKLVRDENPVILSVPFIASLFDLIAPNAVEIMPIRATDFESTRIGNAIIKTILGVHNSVKQPLTVPQRPIEAAASKLADVHRNVLILPAGFAHKDLDTQERWVSGVGKIARAAYLKNPDINIALLRIFGYTRSELSEPIPLKDSGLMPELTDRPLRDSREITANFAKYYNDYFAVGKK